MSEFGNRMSMQRRVLNIVNACTWTEELFGLSVVALDRWRIANHLGPDSDAVRILRRVSERLFFLATRSQEQVDADYRELSVEVDGLVAQLQACLAGSLRADQ